MTEIDYLNTNLECFKLTVTKEKVDNLDANLTISLCFFIIGEVGHIF